MSEPRWQSATAATIGRLQRVFALHPKSSTLDHLRLYEIALTIVQAQGRTANGANEFWGTYVNTLRILVGGLHHDIDPKDIDYD